MGSQKNIVKHLTPILLTLTTCAALFCQSVTGPCSCITDSGIVNLTRINGNLTPRFFNISDENRPEVSYFFNPCSAFSLNDTTCHGVSVCRYNKDTNTYEDFGISASKGNFSTYNATNQLILSYVSRDNKRRSFVLLRCSLQETDPQLTVIKTDKLESYFILSGKEVCATKENNANISTTVSPLTSSSTQSFTTTVLTTIPVPTAKTNPSSLSPGSILMILFVVFVLVYLIAGVIYNKFVRGARGLELVPNYAFWKDFPYLVKDGTKFTIFKITGRMSSYSQM